MKNTPIEDRPVVAMNQDGTLHKVYDNFTECLKEFPELLTPDMVPCMYSGKKFQWLDAFAPVDKLRLVAMDDIKNKA